MMRLRRLGRTGLTVSEYTLGTAGFGVEARAAATLALDRGINAVEIDVGNGNATALIGDILRHRQEKPHIFARVTSLVPFDLPSPHVPAQQAYPGAHIRTETEAMLARLGVDRLAVLQLHAWCPEWLHEGDWLETIDRLRDEGKIAAIGLSLFDHDVDSAFEAVASGVIDVVQLMYNIFDPGAARALFPLCRKHDVGIIARSPLYFGALASADPATERPPGDWRQEYFYDEHRRETAERVHRLTLQIAPDLPVSDIALRFCLSHPAVSTVAVGMRDPRHVEVNLAALQHGPLSAEQLATLDQHKWLC